ncbi:hypothetical protein Q6348_00045 [Isoptericola sp. b441]|uniref:Toxin-antitoxin system HicB family antitoxin n=1 Tax=Actinotalea lenta TaxID=3064654 RepID=A0ABT9D4I6_9CELL|nr:hypothetical protein [Isoptericola sp. b441]MDO8105585.1 hypothetical protein [Isoptericola sp. b441]
MTSDARSGGAGAPSDRARARPAPADRPEPGADAKRGARAPGANESGSSGPAGKNRGAKKRGAKKAAKRERKAMLLRLDPALHDALARWASEDLRSTNAHIEWLLRRALKDAGRLPS